MENISNQLWNNNLIPQYLQQQTEDQFHRIVEGDYEFVDYLPGSSLRFWVNNLPVNYPLHWHPAVEMIMPLENSYTVIVKSEEYHLSPGDIFIIPAGELHHLIAPATGVRLIYLFDFTVLSRIRGFSYLATYLSQPILIPKESQNEFYDAQALLMLEMCNDYFSDNALRELLIYAHLLRFFAGYGKRRMNAENALPYGNGAARQMTLLEKLNKTFEYVDSHFTESLTLEMAADVAGFSKFHFSRLFKQCSGYNFYDYLCYRRIKSAESLLLKPSLSITEIALQSGFCSLSTFNRVFKKLKNCTPSEYRSLYHKDLHDMVEKTTTPERNG
ncbi:MAG: AraC family transcriptional regulator [Clostridium sp.]|jgi:AraC-like DNA-binding protein|nr:AraC family transcriptional regulator [Clostridium sp.]